MPWLEARLLVAVRDYARDIAIDTDAIESAPNRHGPQQHRGAAGATRRQALLAPPTGSQQAALVRLETWLALIEGWVDVVTDQAAAAHLPRGAPVRRLRRRRATGRPAEDLCQPGRPAAAAAPGCGRNKSLRRPQKRPVAWPCATVPGRTLSRPAGCDLDDVLGYVERRRARPEAMTSTRRLQALLRGRRRGGTLRPPCVTSTTMCSPYCCCGPPEPDQGGCAAASWRPWPRTRARSPERTTGPHHRFVPGAQRRRQPDVAPSARQGGAFGCSSADTWRPRTPASGTRPAAKPPRVPGLSGLDPWLTRSTWTGTPWAIASACSEHLDVRFLAVVPGDRRPGQRRVHRHRLVPGRCAPANVAPDVPRLIAVCRDHLAAAAAAGGGNGIRLAAMW